MTEQRSEEDETCTQCLWVPLRQSKACQQPVEHARPQGLQSSEEGLGCKRKADTQWCDIRNLADEQGPGEG